MKSKLKASATPKNENIIALAEIDKCIEIAKQNKILAKLSKLKIVAEQYQPKTSKDYLNFVSIFNDKKQKYQALLQSSIKRITTITNTGRNTHGKLPVINALEHKAQKAFISAAQACRTTVLKFRHVKAPKPLKSKLIRKQQKRRVLKRAVASIILPLIDAAPADSYALQFIGGFLPEIFLTSAIVVVLTGMALDLQSSRAKEIISVYAFEGFRLSL